MTLSQLAQGRQHLAHIAPQVEAQPDTPAEPLARRAYLAGPLPQPPVPRRSPAQWPLALPRPVLAPEPLVLLPGPLLRLPERLALRVVPPKRARLPLGLLPPRRARNPSPLVLEARRDRAASWGPASNPPVVAASPGEHETRTLSRQQQEPPQPRERPEPGHPAQRRPEPGSQVRESLGWSVPVAPGRSQE